MSMGLDFEIDKITESIECVETSERFETRVVPVVAVADLEGVAKSNGWRFDWRKELRESGRQVYKLVTEKYPNVIHGLISLEVKADHVYMHLIESAPFNVGQGKRYLGVAANLIAYGCKVSKDLGFDGVLSFTPKTKLMPYYEKSLGAVQIGGRRLAILEKRAEFFINRYFS